MFQHLVHSLLVGGPHLVQSLLVGGRNLLFGFFSDPVLLLFLVQTFLAKRSKRIARNALSVTTPFCGKVNCGVDLADLANGLPEHFPALRAIAGAAPVAVRAAHRAGVERLGKVVEAGYDSRSKRLLLPDSIGKGN